MRFRALPSLGEHRALAKQIKGIRREFAALTARVNAHYPVRFANELSKIDYLIAQVATRLDEKMHDEHTAVPAETLDEVYRWNEGEGETYITTLAKQLEDLSLVEATAEDIKRRDKARTKSFTASLLGDAPKKG